MTVRLSRRALIGGLAGSAAAAILAACGDAAATVAPPAAPTTAATIASSGSGGIGVSGTVAAATRAAATAAPTGAASTPATVAGTTGTTAAAPSATVAATAAATVAPTAAGTALPVATVTTGPVNAAASRPPVNSGTTVSTPVGTISGGSAPPNPTMTPMSLGSPAAAAMVNPNLTGRLTVYTSQVQADIDALKAAFNRAYPRVEVMVYRDGTEKVIAKLRTEAEAKAVAADVLLIADAPTMENLKADGLLQAYTSPNAAAVAREFVEAEGFYTGTKIIYTGIAVNTMVRPPAPAMWKDLTKADYRGKIVTPSPQYSGAAALNYTAFLNNREYGPAFLMGLKANNLSVVMSNGDALMRVISGEFPVGIVTDNGVRAARARMSPVEMIYPADGAIPITEPVAVVAGTKNLDAAKAFVDFILSVDGQNLAAMQGYVPLIAAATRPTGAPATIRPFPLDSKALAAQLADGKKQFTDIFG